MPDRVCPTCGGNGTNAPCLYPSENKPGCLAPHIKTDKERRHSSGREAYQRNVSPTAFRTFISALAPGAEPAANIDYLFGYIEAMAEDLRQTKEKLAEVSLPLQRY